MKYNYSQQQPYKYTTIIKPHTLTKKTKNKTPHTTKQKKHKKNTKTPPQKQLKLLLFVFKACCSLFLLFLYDYIIIV